MTVEMLTTLVLFWMTKLLSPALAHGLSEADKTVHHWEDTYPATAAALADAAYRKPLFQGEDGARKTAALFVAWSFHESRFDPRAIGDGGKAFGLFQIHATTVPGVPKDDLFDVAKTPTVARDLMLQSFRICRDFPLEERGGWFAAGREGCREEGRKKSKVRIGLAMRIVNTKEESP